MANPKNNIYPIQFDGELNLNNYNSDVAQYSGFNKKNSPVFGGTLSPFWKKEEAISNSNVIVDNDGNTWSLRDGTLFKKDLSGTETAKLSVNAQSFSKTDLFDSTKNVTACLDEDTYLYFENDSLYCYFNEHTVLIASDLLHEPVCCLYKLGNKLYGMYDTTAFEVAEDGSKQTKANVCDNIDDVTNCVFRITSWSFIQGFTAEYIVFSSCHGNFWHSARITDDIIDFSSLNKNTSFSFVYEIHEDNPKITADFNTPINNVIVNNGECIFFNPVVSSYIKDDETISFIGLSSRFGCQTSPGITINNNLEKITIDTVYASKHFVSQNAAGVLTILGNSSYKSSTLTTCGRSEGLVAFECVDNEIDFNQGIKSEVGNFSFLINNKELSGISYQGILLTEWNTISSKKITVSDDSVIYCDNNNQWHKISIVSRNSIQLINNQYIVINTTSQRNMIDIKTEKSYFLFSDYNSWGHLGYPIQNVLDGGYLKTSALICVANSGTNIQSIVSNLKEYYFASGYNSNYEITNNPALSIQINPAIVYSFVNPKIEILVQSLGFTLYFHTLTKEYKYLIDFYYGDTETVPLYNSSYLYTDCMSVNGLNYYIGMLPIYTKKVVKNEMFDLEYPISTDGNIIYSPALFSKFIESFINKNMIVINGNGYPLIYYNNRMLFAYYFLSGIENLSDLFVIQGMSYGVADEKILSLSYSAGSISNTQCVVSVENMKFCGATSTEAYFWADTNKTLYVFKGDNSLNPIFSADSVGSVLFSSFNPTTNSVYIATDIGVFVIGSNGVYKIIETPASEVFRWKHGLVFKYSDKIVLYSFVKLTDFEIVPVELETKFYGLGNNAISVNDCVYLRFFDKDMKAGQIKISSKTLNNETILTEEKTISVKPADWDKSTKTFYVRYQPKNQRCIGFSVAIESPFAIGSMHIGSNPDTILISKTNS